MATNYNLKNELNERRFDRWVVRGNSSPESSLRTRTLKAVLLLDDMRLLLNARFNLRLQPAHVIPEDSCEKNVKKFCGELLDRCVPNPWKRYLRHEVRLSLKIRLSVASSLFSLRKMLAGDRPSLDDYHTKMLSRSPALERNFRDFCISETKKIFTPGWDRSYWRHVNSFTPPNKSNITKKRFDDTYRGLATRGKLSREHFLAWAGGTDVEPIGTDVRAMCVDAGGKWRIITVTDYLQANAKPVHKAIYDRLSKERWLLRGEATAKAFSEFRKVDDEEFVSGDYESATDNVNKNLYEDLVELILSRGTHIPLRVRRECMRIGQSTFVDQSGNTIGRLGCGQLMGSLLSFPLLCLINYLTFKFSVRREVPVKINGDDIVFRARPDEIDAWFRNVRASGLVLSRGKTLVHSTVFSLNSSYFHTSKFGVTLNPLIRASLIMKKCKDMVALAGRVARLRTDLAESRITRDSVIRRLIQQHARMISASQGSLGRRYDIRLTKKELAKVGFLDREAFYMSLPSEPPPPPPYYKVRQETVPPGYRKSDGTMGSGPRVPDSVVAEAMTELAWTAKLTRQSYSEYWASVRDDSYRYTPWTSKVLRLYRLAGGYYRPDFHPVEKKEKFWVRTGPCVGSLRDPVAFVGGK